MKKLKTIFGAVAKTVLIAGLAANLSACAGSYTNTKSYGYNQNIMILGERLEDRPVYRWVSNNGITACWETQAHRALTRDYREIDTLRFTGRYKAVPQHRCY